MEWVCQLIAAGWNASEIACATGIPRSTVRGSRSGMVTGCGRNPPPDVVALPSASYAYLLGVYLGDGHIARRKGLHVLRISCDTTYSGIVLDVQSAIRDIRPDHAIALVRRGAGTCTVVQSVWRDWPVLFPQHGPGYKHERPIVLRDWQLAHTHECPEALVRGLIPLRWVPLHRAPAMPRQDLRLRALLVQERVRIRGIFTDHLRLLGVHWTYSHDTQIDVDRRADVARLDEFVGPKS